MESNNSKMSADDGLVPVNIEDKEKGTNEDFSKKTHAEKVTIMIEGQDLGANKDDSEEKTDINMVATKVEDKDLEANRDASKKTDVTNKKEDQDSAGNKDDFEKTDFKMVAIKIEPIDLGYREDASEKTVQPNMKAYVNNMKGNEGLTCFCGKISKNMRGLKQHTRMKHNDLAGKKSKGASEAPVASQQPNADQVDAAGVITSSAIAENDENADDETPEKKTLPLSVYTIYKDHNYCINPNKKR